MTRFSFKSIAAGAVVMLTLSILFSLILFLVYASRHLPPNPSQAALTEAKIAISQDSAFLAFDLVLGALASAFGGYLAARIVKTSLFSVPSTG